MFQEAPGGTRAPSARCPECNRPAGDEIDNCPVCSDRCACGAAATGTSRGRKSCGECHAADDRADSQRLEHALAATRHEQTRGLQAAIRVCAIILALLATACDEVRSRDLFVGDSILVYASGHINQAAFQHGDVAIFDAHGGVPLEEGGPTGPGWTDFWVSRATSMEFGTRPVPYDCAILSLGSNDIEPPAADNVLAVDAAFREPFWLLPRESVRPAQRAAIQAAIPEERWLDVAYEFAEDGLHPSAAGSRQIAEEAISACTWKAMTMTVDAALRAMTEPAE